MTINTISTLPTAPARTDAPAVFISRADAFLAALVVMQGELNTSIGQMNTDIGGIAANVTAAQAAQTAAELAETNAETAESNASTSETNAQIYAAAAQAAAGIPSLVGNAEKKLAVNATEDGVEWVEVLSDPTLGTLTKTFTTGESSTINLTSSVLTPVVSVTKEVPQSGVTNNNWDVNSTTENYTRLNSAYATTLDWVGFDASTASFVDSFSVAGQDTSPEAVAFNNNGTKMFVLGLTGADVNEYTLSTGFDVSTASFVDSFSVSAQESSPKGLAFNTDGTKMFIVGFATDTVYEYTLSTGFDVSTASYSQNFSVASEESIPSGIAFNITGTKMFIVGYGGDEVNEYVLSTGFDVSTASYSQNFSVASQDTSPSDIVFSNDGTKMFIVGQVGQDVNEYTLSTGFDVSTATYSQNFSVLSEESAPNGIAFNSDGSKMFIVGANGDEVNEYTLDIALTLGTGSFASADVGKTIEANDGVFVLTAADGSYVETTAPTSYDQVASGSWEMYGVVYNAADGDLELSSLTTGFDISAASFVQNFSVTAEESSPKALVFNSDGTKMYVAGAAGQDINQYSLSTAFDISTASYVQKFDVFSQDTDPTGIAFNSDGTKMFFCGIQNASVYEYNLSTGFDVTTASFSTSLSISAQESNPSDISFNTNGTKMFVVGQAGQDVNEYTLSTAFSISTASFVDSFSVATQETGPSGIAFNTDGTKMFICGIIGDDVNEYSLSTGFDVSTASFVQNFSVSAQETNPEGIAFSNDGTKMFILGDTGNDVNEYNTGSLSFPTGYQPVHTTQSTDTQYWTDINSMTADQAAGDGNVYYAISTDDRTTWTVIDNTDGERDIVRNNAGTWQYNSNGTYASETWTNATTNTELAALAEAMEGAAEEIGKFDVSTASFVDSFSVSGEESNPFGMAFNNNGTKMFIVGDVGDDVNEYTLSTAFDVSTSVYSQNFSVSAQVATATALTFNADGTKMYVVGYTGQDVNEYTLSTGFDVSTASYLQNFSVSAQETNPWGIAFNNDGTKMFVSGFGSNRVNEYSLSTGFNISTASYSQSFLVSLPSVQVRGINFNNDGAKMFVVDNTGQEIAEYNLSTAFNVSTATYVHSFSYSSEVISGQQVSFNTDGSKMFILDGGNDAVYEYTVGTTNYANQMDKTQLDAVTDPNHIALGNDLDLSIIFNMTSGTTVPSSDGVAINYDANVLNKGAVLGTDYDFDAPTSSSARITALTSGNFKVRVV